MKKVLIAILLSSLWVFFGSACMNERKAIGYFDKHPERFALLCSRQYTEVDYEKDSSYIKQGKPQLTIDTISYDATKLIDSFLARKDSSCAPKNYDSIVHKPIYIRVPCPPASNRVDTVYRYHYIQTSNTAKEVYLRCQADSVGTVLTNETASSDKWHNKAVAEEKTIIKLIAVIALLVMGTVVSFIIKIKSRFPF